MSSLDRLESPMATSTARDNQSFEVMLMPPPELVQTFGPIMSWVAAASAFAGMVFAFLNWARTRRGDRPYGWIGNVRATDEWPVSTELHIENRGTADVHVTKVALEGGCFAGEPIMNEGGEWLPGPKTDRTVQEISLHVPSRMEKTVPLSFYINDGSGPIFVRLKRRAGHFHAILTANQK